MVLKVDKSFKDSSSDSPDYIDYVEDSIEDIRTDIINQGDLQLTKEYFLKIHAVDTGTRPMELLTFNKSAMIFMQSLKGMSHWSGQFKKYDELLKFILFLLDTFPVTWFTPRMMEQLSFNLAYVLDFVGLDDTKNYFGDAWQAKNTWQNAAPNFHLQHRDFWDEILLQANISIANPPHSSKFYSLKEHFDKIQKQYAENTTALTQKSE